MSITEVLKRRVLRVRLPIWAVPTDYLTFHYFPNGTHGSWARLYARQTQEAIGEPTPQLVLLHLIDKSDESYEEYLGQIDKNDIVEAQ